MLFDIDAVERTIVVSSIAGELYSDDGGKNFQRSVGGGELVQEGARKILHSWNFEYSFEILTIIL